VLRDHVANIRAPWPALWPLRAVLFQPPLFDVIKGAQDIEVAHRIAQGTAARAGSLPNTARRAPSTCPA
tara:strand:+ start:714 stop:920 length:207 start_codon:yes stop_codon:yes gene_type:complete